MTKGKGELGMMNRTIDLSGLPDGQAKLIVEFVDYLKTKVTEQTCFIEEKSKRVDETGTIRLKNWPLGVKGKLTRREIYDFL